MRKTGTLVFMFWLCLGHGAARAEETPAARIDAALRRFDSEPSLDALKQAALRYADADREGARRWLRAPNAAAALPLAKLVYQHDIGRDENLDRYQDEPDRWGADTAKEMGFQVSLEWRLDELVFNPDEVRVWGALADRAERREAVLTMLVGYYFERRRLQVRALLEPPEALAEAAELRLRIAELTASIDAVTGGLLSRSLWDAAKKRPAPVLKKSKP